MTTSFRHLVDTLTGEETFPCLRLINLQGESAYKRDIELYKKHFGPDCILVNSFGGTETLGFTLYFVDQHTQMHGSDVPVGYVCRGREVVLLDNSGREVGPNHVGEITVRSRYFPNGYWRKPELTQAAYQIDPEGGNRRIYRTGDMGRMLPDGCLVHLGRIDSQVKIRGNRVDVAWVETLLTDLESVKEAAVVVREDVPGHKRLVAYVVPAKELAPTVSELRSSLIREGLPDYMIPSAFVMMESLPLTGIGKVDRGRLPKPGSERPSLESPLVLPCTPAEEELVKIWADVLHLEQVGTHDNFLELGGDSLLASQVVSRVIKTFQVELPLRLLFQAPTIAEMAVVIVQDQVNSVDPSEIERMLSELESFPETSI